MYVEKMEYSEGSMQKALSSFFAPNSIKYDIDGLYVFKWESDKLLETRSGYIYEFEVKISKADFKNDFKHKQDKHIILESCLTGDKYLPRFYEFFDDAKKRKPLLTEEEYLKTPAGERFHTSRYKKPNYFYYAVPKDMISVDDVPSYAGLIYVDEHGQLIVEKKAPCLHKEKYKDSELNLGEKFYYNMVHWKERASKGIEEARMYREKLKKEIESKNQEKTYEQLKQELEWEKGKAESFLKEIGDLKSSQNYNRFYQRALVRKIREFDKDFNYFKFQTDFDEAYYDRGERNYSWENGKVL